MKSNVQHSTISTMSPVLLFDIIVQIIDIVGENKDTNLLKELSLVSHCFHQICSKHLFATIELHDADPDYHLASSKKKFVKLVRSRPDVVNYIRKLTYKVGKLHEGRPLFSSTHHKTDDDLLSPILPDFLRTIPGLNCLAIKAFKLDWDTLDSSLTSAFLYLMHLPTINHIDLSSIQNFPLSSLPSSANLHRLDMWDLKCTYYWLEEEIVQSEMMPKIREFHTQDSSLMTTMLLDAKLHDGQPAFNFMGLRRLTTCLDNKQNVRYLVQNAKSLEKLHLSVGYGQSLVGLHDILSSSACTLTTLHLTGYFYTNYDSRLVTLLGLCEELEAMAGHNILETLSFGVYYVAHHRDAEDSMRSIIQNVEKVLVKRGWSALRQVSFKVTIAGYVVGSAELSEALQSLPDKYLSHLPKLESVAFNYSVCVT